MSFLLVDTISASSDSGRILRDISFKLEQSGRLAIAGETGSGKSTLLKVIAGLYQADAGSVIFENKKVVGPFDKLVPGHEGIAYLSQHFELQKSLRVEQVLAYATLISDEEADLLFEVCDIQHLLDRRTNELSGGEKQRIALAKLLVSKPKLLLLDEPYSNLDRIHKRTLQRVIEDISNKLGITCIVVSHDASDTLPWADEIIVIKDGSIIQQAAPVEIYASPVNTYVAGLFGFYNLLDEKQSKSLSKKLALQYESGCVMIRPEKIRITMKRKGICSAKINDVKYFGGYSEIFVSTSSLGNLTVYTSGKNFKSGDVINLLIKKSDVSFVKKTN